MTENALIDSRNNATSQVVKDVKDEYLEPFDTASDDTIKDVVQDINDVKDVKLKVQPEEYLEPPETAHTRIKIDTKDILVNQFNDSINSIASSQDIKDIKDIKDVQLKVEYIEPSDTSHIIEEIILEDDSKDEIIVLSDSDHETDKDIKEIISNSIPSESSSEYKVFVAVEGVYSSLVMNISQIAAVHSDSEKSFHASFYIEKGKFKKKKHIQKDFDRNYICKDLEENPSIRLLEDGTELQALERTHGCNLFISFIQEIIDKQNKVNKNVTLVFYSQYEIWCFLSNMKWGPQVSDSFPCWLQFGLWDLVCQDVKLVYLRPEDNPPNLSDLSLKYQAHGSMLEAVKMLKDFAGNCEHSNVVDCPYSINFAFNINSGRRARLDEYQFISCMKVPENIKLSAKNMKEAQHCLDEFKTSYKVSTFQSRVFQPKILQTRNAKKRKKSSERKWLFLFGYFEQCLIYLMFLCLTNSVNLILLNIIPFP